MAVLKSVIVAFVNTAYKASFTADAIDEHLQMLADDLSEMHVLEKEDTSQTLTSSTDTLSYPSDALGTEQAIISVTLTSGGTLQGPLKHLIGGWTEMQKLLKNNTRGLPKYYAIRGNLIHLYPKPGNTYTTSIWYYQAHAALTTSFTFPADWTLTLKYGAMYFLGLMSENDNLIRIWEARYLAKKEERRVSIPRETQITGE